MNINKWLEKNTYSLQNKTIAITGTTGDIMKQVVKVLASVGANLILINRSKEKSEKQIQKLVSLYPNIKIEFIECDLSDFESVKTATELLKQKRIDILYLAAGVYNVKRYKTKEGFDNIFQTNFVSHYYLVKELIPQLKAVNGKVVAISSIAYNYSSIDENDIDFTRKKANKAYGNSKRFLTFALQELARKENFNLAIVHPGVTLTTMTNHYPKTINWLVKVGIKLLFPTVKKSSLSLIQGAFNFTTYHEWIGPKIFNIWGKPKKQKIKTKNLDEAKKIYNIAENIYKKLKHNT